MNENDVNASCLNRVSEKQHAKNSQNTSSNDTFANAVRWYSENLVQQGVEQGIMPAARKDELVESTINSFKVICSGNNNSAKERIQKNYSAYLEHLKGSIVA